MDVTKSALNVNVVAYVPPDVEEKATPVAEAATGGISKVSWRNRQRSSVT